MQAETQTIMQICRHLEGHPLAIQLVCSWLPSLSPQVILDRLNTFDLLETRYTDIPERQRNLWGVLHQLWSFLPTPEQDLLSQLAMFEAGFDLDAILDICGTTIITIDALVRRSLLITEEGRYRLHSLIRQFVETYASTSSDSEKRYSDYYMAILTTHAKGITNEHYVTTRQLFDTHYANLRKAWHIAVQTGNHANVTATLHDFFLYIHIRGRHTDFRQWLAFANGYTTEGSPFWVMLTFLQLYMDMIKDGFPAQASIQDNRFADCLYHAKQHKQHWVLASLYRLQGDFDLGRDHITSALRHFTRAEKAFLAIEDTFEVARTWNRIGVAYLLGGNLKSANYYFQKSLTAKRQHPIYIELTGTLYNLAHIMVLQSNLPEAMRLIAETYTIAEAIHFPTGTLHAKQIAFLVAFLQGDSVEAHAIVQFLQEKGQTTLRAIRRFTQTLAGLSLLMQNQPLAAFYHLDTVQPDILIHQFWHEWALAWAQAQQHQPTLFYQHLGKLFPIVRHLASDLTHFMALILCAEWFWQTNNITMTHQLVVSLRHHPISEWGLFQHIPVLMASFPSDAPMPKALDTHLETLLPYFSLSQPPQTDTAIHLSEREREILILVSQQLSNQAIAERCHLTVGTVKVHLHRIYQKLGVDNRLDAVKVAHQHRLLPIL